MIIEPVGDNPLKNQDMENETRKDYWDKIYLTRKSEELSWTQENPKTSLDFIHSFNLSTHASIIDVGGGDSRFVDRLIDEGFDDITVLDISYQALKRAKERLGQRGKKINWVVSDITEFKTEKTFDLWHDRATFHFLTKGEEISKYLEIANSNIKDNGFLTIGSFSENGPTKCSGFDITQYSETTMTNRLNMFFEKIRCITVDHKTPYDTIQNFIFCNFRKIQTAS